MLPKIYLPLAILSLSALAKEDRFVELEPAATGVDFAHTLDPDHSQSYLYHSGFAVGGICLGDVNGDGFLDLYLVSGPAENRLYLGSGDSKFEKKPVPAVSGEDVWGTGASLVDIDNDGDLDLYQCNYDSPNQVLLNDGAGQFSEVEGGLGIGVVDASMAAAFADVDNDGDLDLFLLCNRYYNPEGRTQHPPFRAVNGRPVILAKYDKYYDIKRKPRGGFEVDDYGRADYFFLNEGSGADGLPRFKDVSEDAGLHQKGFGLSCAWWDFDGDGDLDLSVANDFTTPDRLYRNDGAGSDGVPKFTDVAATTLPASSWSSMGSDIADVNNDGLPDLINVDMSASSHFKAKLNMGELPPKHRFLLETGTPRQAMRNHLYLNNGTGMFSEAAWAMGVASSDWSWTAKFGDLDNDGWQDLFVSNGIVRNFTNADFSKSVGSFERARIGRTEWEIFKERPPMKEENLVFQNSGGTRLEKRGDWGLGLVGMSYSAAMGDLDNDGDLDLIVSDLGEQVKIYRNELATADSLRVKLSGRKSNRMGIGAKVVVTDSRGLQRTRWMNPWTGFQGQNDTTLHFGLGEAVAAKVMVYWPSGIYQEVRVAQGQREILLEEEAVGTAPEATAPSLRFTVAEPPGFVHEDQVFDDFERQPLLPSKLSQLGPCLVNGDLDGDGDQDFFVGGGYRQEGAVYRNDGGKFVRSEQPALGGFTKYSEDSAALWFDADGDGDDDLLVVSGSSEKEPGDVLYRDRLYLNPGKEGGFELALAPDEALPDLLDSGSCVSAADFDSDGDLDLFIGARSIPGKYPLAPASRLLRNETADGVVKFTEVTPDSIKKLGMVTAAVWTDLDGDGLPDLAVASDWGPVMIFHNQKGELKRLEAAGESAGWWISLAAVDVDGDGDRDLVAGNAGLNTKYQQPSAAKPVMIYYGDMDGSGNSRIVEAKGQKDRDRPLPVRGRS